MLGLSVSLRDAEGEIRWKLPEISSVFTLMSLLDVGDDLVSIFPAQDGAEQRF